VIQVMLVEEERTAEQFVFLVNQHLNESQYSKHIGNYANIDMEEKIPG